MNIVPLKKLLFGCMILFVSALGIIHFEYLTHPAEAKNEADTYVFLPLVIKPWIPMPSQMVFVPAGEFQMGCNQNNPDESCFDIELPLHSVYLDAYYIDRYEVTNDQYAEFLNRQNNNDCSGYDCITLDDSHTRITLQNDQYVVDYGYGNHPVNLVTWYGANAYCTNNSWRLPTEAEWEKAARGSTDTRKYPWGNAYPNCTLVNYYQVGPEKCVEDTAPVGSFPAGASQYGALDMSGNVSEWVSDWYGNDYYSNSPYNNPLGEDTGLYKIQRGGSWYNGSEYIRLAYRKTLSPQYSDYWPGFRCASPSGE